jgi:hypothetical protein
MAAAFFTVSSGDSVGMYVGGKTVVIGSSVVILIDVEGAGTVSEVFVFVSVILTVLVTSVVTVTVFLEAQAPDNNRITERTAGKAAFR